MKCKSGYYRLYRLTNALKIHEKFLTYITGAHKYINGCVQLFITKYANGLFVQKIANTFIC
jgi:hypothetical protein